MYEIQTLAQPQQMAFRHIFSFPPPYMHTWAKTSNIYQGKSAKYTECTILRISKMQSSLRKLSTSAGVGFFGCCQVCAWFSTRKSLVNQGHIVQCIIFWWEFCKRQPLSCASVFHTSYVYIIFYYVHLNVDMKSYLTSLNPFIPIPPPLHMVSHTWV